jgi:hypothetical protein
MPTLQCTSCGATYHTAASGPHLALAPLLFGCNACGSHEPLHIGVISHSDAAVTSKTASKTEVPGPRPPRATASGAG